MCFGQAKQRRSVRRAITATTAVTRNEMDENSGQGFSSHLPPRPVSSFHEPQSNNNYLRRVVLFNLALPQPPIDFQREIRHILSHNCYHCHGPDHSTPNRRAVSRQLLA